MYIHRKHGGFTLLELMIVMTIMMVLITVVLPTFTGVRMALMKDSEDAIIRRLDSAIKREYMRNLQNGKFPDDAWPCQDGTNPFTLMDQPPPYLITGYFVAGTQDNKNWRVCLDDRENFYWWGIFCPHWNGQAGTPHQATKGIRWMYRYKAGTMTPTWLQGELKMQFDVGH